MTEKNEITWKNLGTVACDSGKKSLIDLAYVKTLPLQKALEETEETPTAKERVEKGEAVSQSYAKLFTIIAKIGRLDSGNEVKETSATIVIESKAGYHDVWVMKRGGEAVGLWVDFGNFGIVDDEEPGV